MPESPHPRTPALSLSGAFLIPLKMQFLTLPLALPLGFASAALGEQIIPKAVGLAVMTLFAAFWIVRWHGRENALSWRMLAGPVTLSPRVMLMIVFAVTGLLMMEMPLINWLLTRFPILRMDIDFGEKQAPWAAFPMIVVVAPLTEELVFRGILVRGLAIRYGARRGIVFGALIFALAHLYPAKLPGVFAGGLMLGWLVLRTGSVWPGVFAHMLNNGIAFLAMVTLPKADTFELGWWAPVSLLAGASLLASAYRLARRVAGTGQDPAADRVPADLLSACGLPAEL